MVFRTFRQNVIVRVVALSLSIAIEAWILFDTTFSVTAILVGLIILAQIVMLIRFVEGTAEGVTRFFQSVKNSDFSSTFISQGRGRTFDDLGAALGDVMEEFRKARRRTEEYNQSLQTVIQHVGFGLISFRSDGEVGLMNAAARRLLHIHQIANIKSLASRSPELVSSFFRLRSGDKALVKYSCDGDNLQLAMYTTEYRLGDDHYTLVSLQNIGSELDEKEMEAWQNLIRVLTHEIMNSITPISSLASTVNGLLSATATDGGQDLPKETLDDIRAAVGTIERRSQGLLHFVEAYRTLTRIPPPVFQVVTVGDLLSRVQLLMQAQLDEQQVTTRTTFDPKGLEVTVDPDLIEQVLINLIRNAIQSMACQPVRSLGLCARADAVGRVVVEVTDNGPGIPKEIQPRIFIPFFTTREDGSGIGLSLSRQIMRMHGGTITCQSREGQGTTFALKF